MTTSWIYLFLAIICEVSWATCMKLSDGLTKPVPAIAMIVISLLGIAALAMAVRHIDLSVAYAIWTGSGAVLITIVGFWYFRESVSAPKVLSLALVIVGVIGLKFFGEELQHPPGVKGQTPTINQLDDSGQH